MLSVIGSMKCSFKGYPKLPNPQLVDSMKRSFKSHLVPVDA